MRRLLMAAASLALIVMTGLGTSGGVTIGEFPKQSVVVTNAGDWRLPAFGDLLSALRHFGTRSLFPAT